MPEDILGTSSVYAPFSVTGSLQSNNTTALDVATPGDGFAYIGLSAGLEIFDVSDPSNMSQSGAVTDGNTFNDVRAVAVDTSAEEAYLADSSAGVFAVVDISDRTSPSVSGTVSFSFNTVGRATADGNYVYVTDIFNDTVESFDVSTATSPSHVSTVSDGTRLATPRDIIVTGDTALVASTNGEFYLTSVDVSDPTSLSISNSLDTTQDTSGMVLDGNTLYTTDTLLAKYDVSTPSAPTEEAVHKDGSRTFAAQVDTGLLNGNIWVGDGDGGGAVVDVTGGFGYMPKQNIGRYDLMEAGFAVSSDSNAIYVLGEAVNTLTAIN